MSGIIFNLTESHSIQANWGESWGVLVLLKFQVNSQKLGVQEPQNFEFEMAIAMLKCENLLRTNSTIAGAQ